MALTRESFREEISKSSTFSNIFNKCSPDLQELLINLAVELSPYSCNEEGYVKNMTETSVRFEKPYLTGRKRQNYCMLTLRPKQKYIIVDVRTDGRPISSEILIPKNLGNRYNGGFEWHCFIIEDEREIEEAVRLVSKFYKG
ncbi:MAG: hypothetical protein GX383_01535 [Clostridium sp.]|nr:hypothetical protein [Clostridium sp.]